MFLCEWISFRFAVFIGSQFLSIHIDLHVIFVEFGSLVVRLDYFELLDQLVVVMIDGFNSFCPRLVVK